MAELFERSSSFSPVKVGDKWTQLNVGIGCSSGCGYCVQQKDVEFSDKGMVKQYSPVSVVDQTESSPYIRKDQHLVVGDRTEPFHPENIEDTLTILKELDKRGFTSITTVIMKLCPEDHSFLEEIANLENIRPALLFSYTGYLDKRLEKIPTEGRLKAMETAKKLGIPRGLYCAPLNWIWMNEKEYMGESGENFEPKVARIATETKGLIDAVKISGLYYTAEIQANIQKLGLPEPFPKPHVGKMWGHEHLDKWFIRIFHSINPDVSISRSASCVVSHLYNEPSFRGYYGLRSLENEFYECRFSCLDTQRDICREKTAAVTEEQVQKTLDDLRPMHSKLPEQEFKNLDKFVRIYTELPIKARNYMKQNLHKFVVDNKTVKTWQAENKKVPLYHLEKKEAL